MRRLAPPPGRIRVRPRRDLPPPLEALRRLQGGPPCVLRLAEGTGHRGRPWSFLAAAPTDTLRLGVVPRGTALTDALAPVRPVEAARDGPRVPFAAGWAGFLGYEARSGVEARPPRRTSPLGFPAVWLGRFDAVLAWNHATGEQFASGAGATWRAADAARQALLARVTRRSTSNGRVQIRTGAPRPQLDPATFRRAVASARNAVRRGDIFQANVSQRFDARVEAEPRALFTRLVEEQPAPYMTYVDLGDGRHVLSASPERFLRLRGTLAETDPMKGTRPRGQTPEDDRRLYEELAASEKERAELAMIVDLSRNDLARACRTGSVRVTVPRRLIRFARVHQAISVVQGRLRPGLDRLDLLQAAFPPGSVTGAPKVRAMEIIDALEGEGRGPYCGALGWFDEGGDMDLAVAIRTILLKHRTASYRVGGGITLRSDPHAEWRETLDKGRGLFAALSGREDEQ
ncbi:MAG: anthranilate synthase component I family protein [Planctomycetota bacterium]|nr:anthranilate synthase component I family protein [Planctomycetota bacterium]